MSSTPNVRRAGRLAGGQRHRAEALQALAARAHDELADAVRGVERALRRLRGEALVLVDVAVEHHVGARVVEVLPERLHRGPADARGGEARVVPVGQRARVGVRGQVGPQPGLLWRAGRAAADPRAGRVEHDHVPGADVVAVVVLPAHARRPVVGAHPVEVVEVAGAVARAAVVLVVAHGGVGDRLQPPPARVVRLQVGVEHALLVLRVAQRQHGRRLRRHQQVGGGHLLAAARDALAAVEVWIRRVAGDVAGGADHRVARRCRRGGRRGRRGRAGRRGRDLRVRRGRAHREHDREQDQAAGHRAQEQPPRPFVAVSGQSGRRPRNSEAPASAAAGGSRTTAVSP